MDFIYDYFVKVLPLEQMTLLVANGLIVVLIELESGIYVLKFNNDMPAGTIVIQL